MTASLDWKEFFHVMPGGKYPNEISSAASQYFSEARSLGATLLAWLDANTAADVRGGLSQPLSTMIERSTASVLRIQHYLPPSGNPRPNPMRALEHEDVNLLTLLAMPTEPGLQVRDRDGTWHNVDFERGGMIVNGGEMLGLATGGHYPATPHRVTNPATPRADRSRLSLPMFLHPADDVILSEGITAGSFLERRVREMQGQGWRPVPAGKHVAPSETGRTTTGRSVDTDQD